MMNVDFADVKTVMSNRGMAMMGLGSGTGEDRAKKAVEAALSSPLLDDLELTGARGILVNITCDDTLTLDELELINERVMEIASAEVDMKCGTSLDPALNGEMRVTVVATGLEGSRAKLAEPAPVPAIGLKKPAVVTPMRGGVHVHHGVHGGFRPTPLHAHEVEIPTIVRNTRTAMGGLARLEEYNDALLDIPAFLRHQAD
jgi:cell division protein FtsZ